MYLRYLHLLVELQWVLPGFAVFCSSLKISRRLGRCIKKNKKVVMQTQILSCKAFLYKHFFLGLLEHFFTFLDLQRPLECPSENAYLLAVNLCMLTLLDLHSSFLQACLGWVHRPPGGPGLAVKAHCFRQFFLNT